MNGKFFVLMVLCLFVVGCSSTGFPPNTAAVTKKVPADKRIEVGLLPDSYKVAEVEFHVNKSDIPGKIIKRAAEVMPGGEITECEIEYHGSDLYYEVTCQVKGIEQEVMFDAMGEVYRWEVEVSTDDVPENVMKKAKPAIPGAKLIKAEQILDGKEKVIAYHFKLEKDGIKYKIDCPIVEGERMVVYRETTAEIEVPKRGANGAEERFLCPGLRLA